MTETALESAFEGAQFLDGPKSALKEHKLRRSGPQIGDTRFAIILKRTFLASKAPYDAS